MKHKFSRIIAIALAGAATVGMTGCMSTPDAGTTQVVRNGGPFDNKDVRQIIHNGEGNTWIGWFSSTRSYPASDQQRTYKFGEGDGADAPAIQVPSKDGVQMELYGTFLMTTAFDGSKEGDKLLEKFDVAYGTRKFDGKNAYDLDGGGWSKWLNVVVKPVIDSSVREVIAEFDCKQLVSSCALIQDTDIRKVDANTARTGDKSNMTIIQDRLNDKVSEDIKGKLGEAYFTNIKFSLGAVKPDPKVQEAISSAQSARAEISKAQARVESAKADARANEERQKGYNACKVCGQIDAIQALPKGLTALGGDYAISVK